MRTLALLFLAVPLFASGPNYEFENPQLNAEIENIYKDLKYPNFVNVRASSITATFISVSTTSLRQINFSDGTVMTSSSSATSASTQILDNNGFEIWQRGTSFSAPADAAYLADRFKASTNEAANVTVTKDVGTWDTGLASLKVVVASAGASKYWQILQYVENYREYAGKTVTLSMRVHCNTANAFKLGLAADPSGTTKSAYHTGGSTWETLSVSLTIPATPTNFFIFFGMVDAGDKKAATFYCDSAMLTVGSTALTFVPTNPQQDLARCQRFFYAFGETSASEQLATAQAKTTTLCLAFLRFPVRMRIAPTATVNNATNFLVYTAAGLGNSLSALAVDASTVDGSRLTLTAGTANLVAGNATILQTNNTNASIYFSSDL